MQRTKFSREGVALLMIFVMLATGCKPKKYVYSSPPHYNFSQPFSNKIDLKLQEISGIVWDTRNDEFIAHNDEKGILYYLDRDTKGIKREYTFNQSKGDYEDLAMVKPGDIYILKSNASLYRVVTDSTGKQNSFDIGKLDIGGSVDFESLYYDPNRKALIMLCKNCSDDEKKAISAYAYYPDSIGFDNKPIFTIDVSKAKELSPRSTSRFQPSAARIHPVLNKLFILSSASNQLAIADLDGNVESVYMLAKKLFPQAEGLTFRNNGDMYISNEAVNSKATVLRFSYIP